MIINNVRAYNKYLFAWLLSIFQIPFSSVCCAQETGNEALWSELERFASLYMDGQADSALSLGLRLLPVAEEASDTIAIQNICLVNGLILRDQHHDKDAMAVFSRGASLCETPATTASAAKRQLAANLWCNLANVCYDQKKRQESHQAALKAVRLAETLDQGDLHAMVLPYAGRILLLTGDRDKAVPLLMKGLKAAQQLQLPDQQLLCTALLAQAEDEEHQPSPADNTWLQQSRQIASQATNPFVLGTYSQVSGKIYMRAGELGKAARMYGQIDSVGALDEYTKEEMKDIYNRMQANIVQRDSLATAYEQLSPLVGGYRRLIVLAAILVAVVLVCFGIYVLWQHSRRKRMAEQQRIHAEERYAEGQENERERLARELHDGVANDLLALQMKLDSDGLTPQAMGMLRRGQEQVRRMSHELLPPQFEYANLLQTIANYAAEQNGLYHRRVELQATPADADWAVVPPKTALEVYRIVQESVANAQKHAQATLISIGLQLTADKQLTVTVSDDGFPKADDQSSTGIGRITMQQRAAIIGGVLNFYRHKYGYTVKLTVEM